MVFNLLLYFNFPPCVPPYNGLRSTSLFKLPPPYVPPYNGLQSTSLFQLPPLRSTIQWSPWSPSISFLYSNFCIPPYNSLHGLHSTSVFKLSPRVCLCITFFVILSVLTGLVNIFQITSQACHFPLSQVFQSPWGSLRSQPIWKGSGHMSSKVRKFSVCKYISTTRQETDAQNYTILGLPLPRHLNPCLSTSLDCAKMCGKAKGVGF